MKILCLIKFTPNVDDFVYNPITNLLERENSKLVLNPDDASAIALALKLKKLDPNIFIEIVTMGPKSIAPLVKDILRLDVDRGVMLTDSLFAGSDTYATSKIIVKYLSQTEYDLILTGSHSLDGDTAHIPSQVAQLLHMVQCSYVCSVDYESILNKEAIVTSMQEDEKVTLSFPLPAIISVQKEIGLKMPFVRYKDLKKDVDHKLFYFDTEKLGFLDCEIGLKGSKTKVKKTFVKTLLTNNKQVVVSGDESIQTVYDFLLQNDILKR